MMTIAETQDLIIRDPQHWRVCLMDFVDDFRYYRNSDAVKDGIGRSDPKMDALLASVTEHLCREMDLETPEWVGRIPALRDPWFVSGLETLKALAVVESPASFRIRKIFVLENFLNRV